MESRKLGPGPVIAFEYLTRIEGIILVIKNSHAIKLARILSIKIKLLYQFIRTWEQRC